MFAQAVAVVFVAVTLYRIVDHSLTKGDIGPQLQLFLATLIGAGVKVWMETSRPSERAERRVKRKLEEEDDAEQP
jgi:hypothetical protein